METKKIQNFIKDWLYEHWASGETWKGYRIGRMSYGEYFLEPKGWKGGELDGFARGTLWVNDAIDSDYFISWGTLFNKIKTI